MFPHRPPVLSRLEGNLSVQQVIIHEAPPVAAAGQPSSSEQEDCGYGENHSIMGSVPMTATATTPSNREPLYDALASTIVWNKWSVVSNLSDLLDFLLDLATSLDSNSENASASALSRPAGFQSSSSRLVSSDEGAWQTHSLSSSSSWTGSQHDSARELHFLMEEHKLDDPTSATATITMSTASGDNTTAVVTKNDKSVGSLSFLPPNRFDVGYQKYSNGKSVGFEAAAAATTSTPSELEKIHDDAAMDMNE